MCALWDKYNEAMKKDASSYITSILGLIVAGIFLYFTFRDMDFAKMGDLFGQVQLWQVAAMVFLCFTALLVRGVRWYYLLPQPRKSGEMLASQRSLALSYGINNLASRVGEVARILVMKRDSGRSYSSITASVAADRLAFDSFLFAAIVGFSLISFREPLLETFPQLERAVPAFVAVTIVGIAGLFVLGMWPGWCKQMCKLVGLTRIEFLWSRLEPIIDQLALGLKPITQPKEMLRLHLLNLLAWGLALLNFILSLSAFGITASMSQTIMLFTVASFGFLLPSPGGMGTVHYFMTLGCTTFLGTDETTAAAAATICHGINYLVLTAAAVGFFFTKPSVPKDEPLDT